MNKEKTLVAQDFINKPTFWEKIKIYFKKNKKFDYNQNENRWALKTLVKGTVKTDGYFYPHTYGNNLVMGLKPNEIHYKIFWPWGTERGLQIKQVKMATNIVTNYKTKNKEGFTAGEISKLLKEHFPEISYKNFDEKMGVVTAMLDGKTKEVIYYHCDVDVALRCAIEDREMTFEEWD